MNGTNKNLHKTYRAGAVIIAAMFLLFGAVVFGQGKRALAVNTEYDNAKEASYATTYKDVFNDPVSGSPLDEEVEDGVDTANGHLKLLRSDLDLEGMNGMDLSLDRYYDSNKAYVGYATVESVDVLPVHNMRVWFIGDDGERYEFSVPVALFEDHRKALDDMFYEYYEEGDVADPDTTLNTERGRLQSNYRHNVYGISTGWAYDFPWIETMSIDGGPRRPMYLHWGSAGTMGIDADYDEDEEKYTIAGLEDYDYSDIKLEDIDKKVDGVDCRYLLRDKTGTRTYFNNNGVVALQKDAHGNTIRFSYRDGIYFDEIVDSVGRRVRFQYEEAEHDMLFLKSVTVAGDSVSGGVPNMRVDYAMEPEDYKSLNGPRVYGCTLTSVKSQGSVETYGYRTVETMHNPAGNQIGARRAITNEAYFVDSVKQDGGVTKYEYRAGVIRGDIDEADWIGDDELNRHVATQFYYVTREWEEDEATKKRANVSTSDF